MTKQRDFEPQGQGGDPQRFVAQKPNVEVEMPSGVVIALRDVPSVSRRPMTEVPLPIITKRQLAGEIGRFRGIADLIINSYSNADLEILTSRGNLPTVDSDGFINDADRALTAFDIKLQYLDAAPESLFTGRKKKERLVDAVRSAGKMYSRDVQLGESGVVERTEGLCARVEKFYEEKEQG